MDDALLVGVLDRGADRDEQVEACPSGEILLITVVGDGLSRRQDRGLPRLPSATVSRIA